MAGLGPSTCEANATTARVRRTQSPFVSGERDHHSCQANAISTRVPSFSLLVHRQRHTRNRLAVLVEEGSLKLLVWSDRTANFFTLSRGEGTPLPSPLSLTGRFWRAESLVALSFAKTSGKSVDWSGGHGDVTQTAFFTVTGSDWLSGGHLTRSTLIGRGPPRGSSLNSAHHGVGQSEVKVRVMLALL